MVVELQRQTLANDPPDVLLTLPLGRFGTGAFGQAAALIAIGREAARAALPLIHRLTAAQNMGSR